MYILRNTTRHIMYQNENLVVISKVSEQIDSTYSALQEGGKGSTAIWNWQNAIAALKNLPSPLYNNAVP